MIPIKFKCPKCGSDRLQDITKGAIQTAEILGVDEDGLLVYGDSLTEGGKTDRFQCGECGEVIKDATGKAIRSLNRMAEWLKEQAGKTVVMSRVKHMRGIRMGLSDKKVQEYYQPSGRIDATSQEMIDAYRKNVSPHLDIEKVKAIALTIAELDFCGPVAVHHFAEAVQYQPHLLSGFNEVLEKVRTETVEVGSG